MANLITTTILVLMATSSVVYADDYNSYQAIEQRAEAYNAQVSQGVDMQNMQNHMNQQQTPAYQPPSYQPQPMTQDSMYGTVYVGPGSGYTQR